MWDVWDYIYNSMCLFKVLTGFKNSMYICMSHNYSNADNCYHNVTHNINIHFNVFMSLNI